MAQTSWLYRPDEDVRTPAEAEIYLRARTQHRIHSLVLGEFEKSGMSKADLARRTGRKPEVISRVLGQPGNWTLNTISDLLFALTGAELSNIPEYPLEASRRNLREPEWAQKTSSAALFHTRVEKESPEIEFPQ